MGKFLSFLVNEIADQYVRENFRRLNDFTALPGLPLLTFTRIEFTLTDVATLRKIPHGLGFTPQDVVQTWVTGPAVVAFNYDKFDSANIVVTSSGGTPTRANPVVVRCLVGSWDAGASL